MIVQKLLPLGLAFIMFDMGLTLALKDFTRLLRQPVAVGAGLFVQMLLLPLMAFLLLLFFPLRPEFAVGVMILAACPGGITSNKITQIARGDVALSITLTTITSLVGMITIPLIVAFALDHFAGTSLQRPLPVAGMAWKVFVVATLPLVIGMIVHRLSPPRAAAISRVTRPLSLVVFAAIVVWAFVSQWQVMMRNIAEIGPVVTVLNVVIMAAGYGIAARLSLPRSQAAAIAIEGGLQNGALGIYVAVSLLDNPAMMTPSITYALVMNATALLFIAWRLQAVRGGLGVGGGPRNP